MKPMVVLFALVAAACGSLVPLAQPAHHPALVLDPHGRPLDTAEVIGARALHLQAKALEGHYAPLAHSVYAAPALVAAPAAVSHQSRVDVRTSPAVVSHVAAAPVYAHSAYAAPLLGHSYGVNGLGHLLKKRSLGHLAYSAPIVAHATPVLAVAPSAVSHQSRVDVRTSPAVVSHSVVAPVVAHAAPVYAHAAPVYAHSAYATPLLGNSYGLHGLGHLLKKRSLGHLAYSAPIVAHAASVLAVAPSAVSHQSRVDVRTSPAVVSHSVVAPVVAHAAPVYAHAAPVYAHVAPSAVSHQSRVDVRTSPAVVSHSVVAPVAHSVYAAAPLVHSSYHHSSPLVHAW